jgi:DNA-binding CsgD family transcriptional regulator
MAAHVQIQPSWLKQPSHEEPDFLKYIRYLPAIVLAGAMLFFAYDILVDLRTGLDGIWHIVVEMVVFVAISIVLGRELLHVRQLNRDIVMEKSKTARLAGEMLAVINKQFQVWGLSSSEAEIALLLIKGLSMKEIAEARNVRDKTVRTQAASIYAKTGHSGRHELAAYFIEDLMSEISPALEGQ